MVLDNFGVHAHLIVLFLVLLVLLWVLLFLVGSPGRPVHPIQFSAPLFPVGRGRSL